MTTQSHCRTRETYLFAVWWWGADEPLVLLVEARDTEEARRLAFARRPRSPHIATLADLRASQRAPTERRRFERELVAGEWMTYSAWNRRLGGGSDSDSDSDSAA